VDKPHSDDVELSEKIAIVFACRIPSLVLGTSSMTVECMGCSVGGRL